MHQAKVLQKDRRKSLLSQFGEIGLKAIFITKLAHL